MSSLKQMKTPDLLQELLNERILLLDGSMGALIFSRGPTEEDYRGERFRSHPRLLKNCTEALVLTRPRMIEDIHRAYLEAGADVIETCTFNGTGLALEEFALQEHVGEINRRAAELARHAADEFTRRNPDRPRLSPAVSGRPTRRYTSSRAGKTRARAR
jgi:5-methyltetrahydrofolate--homocysteine methyltransferase